MSRPERPVDKELAIGESSTGVAFSSFMTAVVVFFAGLLLTGPADVQERLRVPLVLLFVSAFGFLYGTLIYANASGDIARRDPSGFERAMSHGNVVTEFFGVYGLVLAIPLAVLGYSPDRPVAVAVLVVAAAGFALYHALGYSILQRYCGRRGTASVVGVLLVVNLVQFVALLERAQVVLYLASAVGMTLIAILATVGLRRGHEA